MHQVAKIQSPQDILAILWRRKWQVIVPAFVLFSASIVVALAWPRTYQSKATILIEEPDVSRDILGSAIDYRADERVQVITQQVLSRRNLISLIEKLNLYPEARNQDELGAAAAGLRERIIVDFISAEVSDPRMVRPGQTAIAFTLSFVHKDPQTAQTVVDELVSLYLAENLRTRKAKATQTTEFLAKEAEKLARQISELETKLAAFKLKNSGSLPEQVAINQQAMYRIEFQLLELRHQIQSHEERKVFLEAQLTQVSPYVSITLNDGTVLRPEERLTMLESEYSKLSYTYGPKHPTMVEIATEIENLRNTIGVGAAGSPETPSNPAYIQLHAELKTVNSNLSSLKSERAELSKKLAALESQTLKAPDIERDYLLITRNYENATAEYRAIQEKLWEAERLESLETEQKGERFSVIEPPEVPFKPIAPKRRVLALVGFMIAVVGGLGTAAVAEALDQTVSSPRQLAAITGAAPLVVIPYIETSAEMHRARSLSFFLLFGLTVVFASGLFAVNEFVVPLDDLWAKFGPGAGST
jgi:succinoglycan biosynthesis transport protein ExoP